MLPESPFHAWPEWATPQTVASVRLPEGTPQCAPSRPDCLDILDGKSMTWPAFMAELKRRHRDGHYVMARLLYGSVGHSRDVSREHPLNEGETLQ